MKKCLTIATTLAAVATMATGAKWDNVKTPPPTLTELLGLDSSKESETVTPTDTTQSPDSAPTHQTPKHWRKRAAAAAALEKPATKMKKTVVAVTEQNLPVGAVVLVVIDKVDHSKVCPKRLLFVIIEKVHDKYRLACWTGVLANCLACQDFIHEPSKTPIFYQLDEALANWKLFRVINIRTGSTANSMVCGQGHVHCNCSGECNSK